nr:hypothetical protein [Candidatus Gracilibacteria bacterium]
MVKKVFSFIVLVVFLTSSLNITFAENSTLLSASRAKIKTLKNGSKYLIQLNKVDKFIDSQTDSALLAKLKISVDGKKEKIIPSILGGSKSNDLNYELLNYISLKLSERLNTLSGIEQQKIIDLFNNPDLTSDEIKKVEDEIVKLQLNLFDSSKTFIDKLVSNLQDSINLEEKGNLKINAEGSGSLFGTASGELNITNYASKISNFDSEFKAQVDLLINSSLRGGEDFKTQFSSFINFISKDGNIYILLDKLNYSGIDSSEIETYLAKLKELAANNEYLKFEDQNSTYVLNLIRNFDLNSIYGETNKILLNPMFRPYKKDGDRYLLLPTKEACDAIKGIEYKIAGKGVWYCSDNEYDKMLKESLKNGNFYIVIDGNEKYLGYDMISNDVTGGVKVYYSDKKIEKILVRIDPKDNKYKGEYFELNFVNGQKLDIVLNAMSENMLLSFKSLLSSDNKFNKINFIGNFTDFTSSFNLENKKFNGNFENKLKRYNYDYNNGTGNYEDSGKIIGTLSGELNSENTLISLNLDISGNENANKYNYDWNTGKSSYTPVNSIFNLKYTLKNEIISGNISYKEGDNELFSLNSTGKYRKNYFELNNIINFLNPISFTSDKETVVGNLNIKYEGTLNKNNSNIYLDVKSKTDYIKIIITSDYEKNQNNNIKIEAPTKYKTIDEVFPKNNSSNNDFFYQTK